MVFNHAAAIFRIRDITTELLNRIQYAPPDRCNYIYIFLYVVHIVTQIIIWGFFFISLVKTKKLKFSSIQ